MSMEKFIEAWRIANLAQAKSRRTIIPGEVGNVTRESDGEQDADFIAGIPELVAGEADEGTPSPDAPRLNISGGGFYFLMPVSKGDECVGLTSDRSLDEWRESRTTGLPPVFERVQDDSDVLIAPLAIGAPAGAPDSWDGPVFGGPAGPAFELAPGGAFTITKQGTPVATIEMDQGGSITLSVEAGQSVNLGGVAAVALHKAALMETAIDTFIAAGVAAGTGAVGTTGTLAFTAAQSAWNLSKAGGALQTTKAKGE